MIPPVARRRDPLALWIPAGVFFAALVLRLVYLLQLHASGLWDYLRLDPLYYHDWAMRIAEGQSAGSQTYEMTPLYAYALAGLFRLLGHDLLLPRLLQAAAGALSCATVALLGCRIFGKAEGMLAGLALAAYGPALFHESQIMKTCLTMALTTATAAVLYFSKGRRPGMLLCGGLLLGLTALSQENINITLPFLLAWISWRAPRGRRLAFGAALVAGFACAVAPVTLRNYHVSGDFVLITSGGGEVFYTGNNELASGSYRAPAFVRPDPFFEHEDFRAEAARRLGRPVTRKESDAFWWREGLRFIFGNPRRYTALLWDKLITYLNSYERPDNYSYENFRRFIPFLNLPLPSFGWVAPIGLIGVALSCGRWADLLPLHVTMGSYGLSALLFFTQDRYRMPMVPLLILFAAHGAVRLAAAIRRREARLLAWSLPALGAITLLAYRDPGNELAFEAQNHAILGEMYLYAGRPSQASGQFRRTLQMLEGYPGDSAGQQHLRVKASSHYGIVLAMEAQAAAPAGSGAPASSGVLADSRAPADSRAEEEMILHHLRAASSSPDPDLRRDALDRLGRLMLQRGDATGAAEAYADAVRAAAAAGPAGPDGFSRRLRLAEALHKAGRPREALEAVEEAVRESPQADPVQLADAHYGKALIYMRDLPDRDQASRNLREVLRLNPAHPRAEWIRSTLASLEGR